MMLKTSTLAWRYPSRSLFSTSWYGPALKSTANLSRTFTKLYSCKNESSSLEDKRRRKEEDEDGPIVRRVCELKKKKEEWCDGTRAISPANVQGPSDRGLRTERESYHLLTTRKPGTNRELKAQCATRQFCAHAKEHFLHRNSDTLLSAIFPT